MITRTDLLRPAYLDLLRANGAEYLVQPPPPEELRAAEVSLLARWRNAASAPTEEELASRLTVLRQIGTRTQEEAWSWEQVWLDALAADLDAAVPFVADEYMSADEDVRVYVGVFPTGRFNAQACPASGRYLLLINQGLMMLFYQTMRIYSWAVRDASDPPPQPMARNAWRVAWPRRSTRI